MGVFYIALELMLKGMCGIFAGLSLIAVAVWIMQKISQAKSNHND